MVDGVATEAGLLLLVVEKVEVEVEVVLLLCSILLTVVTIDEALQDNKR